jgi:hypothetical protein
MPQPETPPSWSLEVVRGADVGRRYALPRGETVVGNALNGSPGLDLADQEGAAPRRMAARQARLQCSAEALTLFDLGSPGGTFVNRERVVPFQPRPLRDGDVLQLASVQLRVTSGNGNRASQAPPAAASRPEAARATTGAASSTAPFVFTLKAGPVCRSWDDFLTVSAQRWNDLRDELTSGRLAAFLVSTGRGPLAPDPAAPGNADERLDAWLATLPATRAPSPELDVHPDPLLVRATSRGGTTRAVLNVSNVGYRLLRTAARVEPAGAAWLTLADPSQARPFPTVDRTEVPLDVAIPDDLSGPLSAAVVLESNGGTRRVGVTLEPAPRPVPVPADADGTDRGTPTLAVRDWLASRSPRARLIGGALLGGVGRLVLGIAAMLAGHDLIGPLLLGGLLGMIGGIAVIGRRGGAAERPYGGFAGAFGGLLAAEVAVVACRSIEPVLGATPSLWVVVIVWSLIGAALAGLSLTLVPYRPRVESLQ